MENEKNANQAGASALALSRQCTQQSKPWDQCGIEEKVERLRNELVDMRRMGFYTRDNARRALDLATRHQHNAATGEVLSSAIEQRHGAELAEGRGYDPLR